MVAVVERLVLGDIATGEQTGTVGEPTVATSGQRMMMTGNWFASRSTDGGSTWAIQDPFTSFPSAAGGFCCDQVVLYDRASRRWVWFLQYITDASGSNIARVAVSATGAPGTWSWWDIAPGDQDPAWSTFWFDYPDLATSTEHLYISTNIFDRNDRWQGAAALRLPLQSLASGRQVAPEVFATTEAGSLRFTTGAQDTMVFASHNSTNTGLQLFSWRDDEPAVTEASVPISPWNEGPYTSRGPGGAEWLARVDGRITGGWRSKGRLGFAWTAGAAPGRPHPHVRAARLDADTLALLDEPDLWSLTGAWAYPATCPNQRGDVGMTAFWGGPTHPAHAVGWLSPDGWDMAVAATSTHGPLQGKWGDYLSLRPDPRRTTYWVASGYLLTGGQDRRNVDPQVVVFGP